MAETRPNRRLRQAGGEAGNFLPRRRQSAVHARRSRRLGLRPRTRLSRTVSLHPRRAGHDVSRPPVDHAAVRRHGRRRRVEPPLQVSAEPGHHRTERRVRSADADRARLRQPAGHGRSRQGGRGHRFHRRHDAAVRRHQPGEDLHLDDHQRHRVDPAGAVHRGGATHRARRAQALRHHPERCAEGIHRARDLHLSAGAGDAHHHRHFLLRQPARARVEHDFHLRLPHARGGMHRGAGSRVHPGQRHDLRAGGDRRRARRGQVRAAPVVLLQRAQQFSGGGGEVPRRPPHVGAHHARPLQAPRIPSRRCCASTPRRRAPR